MRTEHKSTWQRFGFLLAVSLFLLGISTFAWRTTTGSSSPSDPVAKPELVLQTGHTSRVNCIAFGPDGTWLASGGADNSIKIWDVRSGRELRPLNGHTGWIKALAVSRDGKWVASGSNDRTVRVWDVISGQQVKYFSGHTAAVESLAFSDDARLLASGSADNTIRVWDISSGTEKQTLKGHTGWVTALAFSPDGKLLASGSADHLVKLWDTASWRERASLQKHLDRINAVAFSPDSNSLASGGADGNACVWRVGSDKERWATKRGDAAILSVSFSSAMLQTASADGSISGRDLGNGNVKWTRTSTEYSGDPLTSASFNPDGSVLGATTGNRTVILLTTITAKVQRTLESHSTGFYSVAASRDGKWLASGANDRSVRLWQTSTGREMPRLSGSTGWITSLSFSPDDRLLASGSISGEVKVWDLRNGKQAYQLSTDRTSINSVVFSADQKWLAAAGVQRSIQLWDLATKNSRTLTGHAGEITSLSFSPEEGLLASGSTDKTIRLWDPATGNALKTLATLPEQVNAITFSPDGKSLAAASADKNITLWEIPSGRLLKTFSGHTGEVLTVSFSPDGHSLVSGSSDHTLKLWDIDGSKELRTLVRSTGSINSAGFGPDGSWVISGDDDGSLAISDPSSGSLMVTLVSMRDSDDWLVVTPDGSFDGSPSSWGLLLWRFARNTFSVSPVESFFTEFYYPGLLSDVLAGKYTKPTRDITQKDRRAPQIQLVAGADASVSSPAAPPATRRTLVRITVNEAGVDSEHSQGSGARDLRLFRNGLLVKVWSGDLLTQGPMHGNEQKFEAILPIVAGENRFTAYAFNRDNVKSQDVTASVLGADSLKRTGTAYVLAIGVGRYENSEYNLNYSVADAQAIGEQWSQQQQLVGLYNPIVVIPLLNEEATKANILLALRRLAGSDVGVLPPNAPASLAKIRVAQPEDAVLVYFSGHGTAQHDRFYLIPHDLGYQGSRSQLYAEGLQTILTHSVSDVELEDALRPLDSQQLLLVIDACNSGQALEAEEKRRGPMNTRGLAQLAYEKGMYVLTASQSVEVAFESAALQHSYLAYALIEEGIKSGAADSDRDGQVVLDEWFDYAMVRVPRMGKDKRVGSKELIEVEPDERRVQRPRAFYAVRAGSQPLVVARIRAQAAQ
ncbi:MAG TPA: caspase family protein [Pyrinomonadaceae bacterium]|nr:caspase family protein [Pyrinomonadaceae bacterium]